MRSDVPVWLPSWLWCIVKHGIRLRNLSVATSQWNYLPTWPSRSRPTSLHLVQTWPQAHHYPCHTLWDIVINTDDPITETVYRRICRLLSTRFADLSHDVTEEFVRPLITVPLPDLPLLPYYLLNASLWYLARVPSGFCVHINPPTTWPDISDLSCPKVKRPGESNKCWIVSCL